MFQAILLTCAVNVSGVYYCEKTEDTFGPYISEKICMEKLVDMRKSKFEYFEENGGIATFMEGSCVFETYI